MNLVRFPDPILNQVSREVTESDLEAIINVVPTMTALMLKHNGVGLAAVQAGMLKRFAILNRKADPYYDPNTPATSIIINPEILDQKNMVRVSEGCLSLPLFSEIFDRAESITVKYRDENWVEKTEEFTGLMAQCLQHEIEHFDGILQSDKVSIMKKQMWEKKLKKAAKFGAKL